MSTPVLHVEHLCKKFCRVLRRSMWYGATDAGRIMLGIQPPHALRPDEFWAVSDVSLELQAGQAIGIIGRNGSGKTTLLRLLNGIFPPTKGRIRFRGRMGALIAVGAGFHPHMTGLENIYLNGAILGMDRRAIRACFDDIVHFADIGPFLGAPVATYSSGMVVRLGFAIAIHARPEILLADEILAVGDLGFALKCYRKIAEYRNRGGALLLVSHSMQLIRNVCDRTLWMEDGAIRMEGAANEVCTQFEQRMHQQDACMRRDGAVAHINPDPTAQITGVDFLDAAGQPVKCIQSDAALGLRIRYQCRRRVERPVFTFGILTVEGLLIISSYSSLDGRNMAAIDGEGFIDAGIPSLPLKPGAYLVTVTLAERTLDNVLDWHEKAYTFSILGKGRYADGLYQPEVVWTAMRQNA